MSQPPASLVAALSDRYRLERELGQGGMATVYLAEDLKHHRKVAVKVLRPEIAASLGPERFAREIEVAARLQHPHILGLLDSGQVESRESRVEGAPLTTHDSRLTTFFFYVMPYIDGESLRDRLSREGALPVAEAVRILREVTDALAAAHAHGVVHRDIKPENVLLSGRHALVADFGVAKAVSEASGPHNLTTAGVALGTPAYMAPEQAAADPHVDHRADLYAVGVMGYELLTGQPPFVAATPQAVLAAHVTQAPLPVNTYRPSIPAELGAVIMKCLEKRAPDRWQSAGELLEALERCSTPGTSITPTETRPMPAAPRQGRRQMMLLATAGVVAVAAILGWLVLRSRPAAPRRLERIALLPLANQTGDTARQILAEGLTREIISALTRARVRITGFASVARYAGKETPLPQVAKELNGVNAVAVGSLVRAGSGGVTLAIELLDPATGDNLWSSTYAVGPNEVASLANRAAGDLAGAIQAPVTRQQAADLAARPQVNAEAYSEYLLGRHLAERFTPGDAGRSLEHLERAVALDSTFAPAYAALGYVYASAAGWYGWIPDSIAYPRAERAIGLALTLDDRLGLAYMARASLRWFRDWDWRGAESDFQRAIELEPGSWAYEIYEGYLWRVGRLADAVEAGARSVEADPSSPAMHSDFANLLLSAGLPDRAAHEAQLAVALDSNYAEVYRNLAFINLMAGRPDTALSLLNRYEAMSGVRRPDARGLIYIAQGRKVEAGRLADSLYLKDPTGGFPTEWAATILGWLGRKDEAFRALEAVNQRKTHWYFAAPLWDPLRSDPRFAAMIRRSGLDPTVQYPPGSTRR